MPSVPAATYTNTPGGILLLLFYGLAGKGFLKNNAKAIHSLLFELKARAAFLDSFPVFEALSFNEHGLFPHSKQVDTFLSNLQQAGSLSKRNPYYGVFEIDESLAEVYTHRLMELAPQQRALIESAVAELAEALKNDGT
ncbi:hypothetical protein IT575_00050 [bacterium]|nr:hypothetical protein [bacterium]